MLRWRSVTVFISFAPFTFLIPLVVFGMGEKFFDVYPLISVVDDCYQPIVNRRDTKHVGLRDKAANPTYEVAYFFSSGRIP